jgi:thiol:disulfide interchange protein DsbD
LELSLCHWHGKAVRANDGRSFGAGRIGRGSATSWLGIVTKNRRIARVLGLGLFGLALLLAGAEARAVSPDELLEPEQAFRFSARAVDASALEVQFDIAEGYYLYRKQFAFAIEPAAAKLGSPQFPAGEFREDRFFGRSETYRNTVRIKLPLDAPSQAIKLLVTSQGCADVGVCYPPQEQDTVIQLADVAPSAATAAAIGSVSTPTVPNPGQVSEEERFNSIVKSGSVWATLVAFFGAGLLLAFTPCVLPMVPILSGIIVGQGQSTTRRRAFLLSSAYVLGMALTYTAIGVGAALSGTLLSTALQNAWVLGGFAIVLVLLALSMFGLYELRLPQFLMGRLDAAQRGVGGGRVASVAAMGMLSAVIVSPCVAAPLAGALLYISQTGDSVLGGTALFAMAAGMGFPLLLVGVFGAALLPKSGSWMFAVKQFFGVLLLALALWMVAPVIPVATQMLLWAALLVGVAVFLRAIDPLPHDASGLARLGKAVGVLMLVGGLAQGYGALSGASDPLQPLGAQRGARDAASPAVRFESVSSVTEIESRLRDSRTPVMLDFFAEWCVACKEMDRFTLSDPKVQARLAGMVLLRADVTANTPEHKALLKRFRLFGPPGIVFFDGGGREITDLRVIGYQAPEKFLGTLDLVSRRATEKT